MKINFSGKVVVVTGAAQGIGREIARSFASEGATVHATDIDLAGMQALAGEGIAVHAADLGSRSSVRAMVDAVISAAGRIDILAGAAGGVRGQVKRPLEEITEADWAAVFDANIHGAFRLCQAVAPAMKRQNFGRIITISSGAGLRPSLTGIQAYAAAKHALVGLTRQLSFELGPHGITVNSVAPGFLRSNPASEAQWQSYGADGQQRLLESIHMRRLGEPGDIAAAVRFLASDAASWISGQILEVNGGRS